MWLGSDGKFYAPGDSVPADVTKLTAQFALSEQFSLKPGGTYYFDLSSANIPGTANGSLPDSTLHYVPFTYAGDVYKRQDRKPPPAPLLQAGDRDCASH